MKFTAGEVCHDIKVESNYIGIQYEFTSEFTLSQLISCPTKVGLHSQSTIDLIFANINNIFEFGCLDCTISDHYPVFMVKTRAINSVDRIEVRKRKLSEYNREVLVNN